MNRHREKRLELKRRDRRQRFWNIITLAALFVLLVFVGVYLLRVTPVQVDGGVQEGPTQVSFSHGHLDWLEENYNQSVENGFCLFGRIQGDKVVVEDVEYVDNPLRQDEGSMRFSCLPQLVVRSGELVREEEYKLVGAVHTHPQTVVLSKVDRETFSDVESFVSVFGVFNGEALSIYSRPQGDGIEVLLRATQ